MSQATLKIIQKDGIVVDYKEYGNSHGGAPFIWAKIYNRYVQKDPNAVTDSWLFNSQALWKLSSDKTIPFFVRVVLASTYDSVLIKKVDLQKLIECYKKFVEVFQPEPNISCHLPQWIIDIGEIDKDDSVLGIGFHATSVSEDLWSIYEEKEEEYRPYDINQDSKHWYLFDEIKE